jgi:threonyl-tRNA synthetase
MSTEILEATNKLSISTPFPNRIKVFERVKAKYEEKLKNFPRVPISIKHGEKTFSGTSWETRPVDILKQVSLKNIIVCKVNGKVCDLDCLLEGDCTLEFLDFENKDGRAVFWHSSAHILGEACESHYQCLLCIGPPTEEGFYYEMSMPSNVTPNDFKSLENLAKEISKQKQKFERLEMTKEELLEMFEDNVFKVRLIKEKIPDGTNSTVYRCGPLIDLCRGPHVQDTGKVKAFAVLKNSSSYWLGDAKNESLQRIYGISFPSSKEMTEYKKMVEEAAKRDHRKIGREQELFFFNDLSPGSAFFLPHGARIYNTLIDYIRSEYRKRGFTEVVTPNVYNVKLWETSGHWLNYRENMFSFQVEKEDFALKPMNCPGHCLMFCHRDRSYRDLPIRFADFGVLHRNELSGALSGLTRVRRFQQDDAHIFCMPEQLQSEMAGCLDFLKTVYGVFGFTFHLKLSTRPEKYLGDLETWNLAEKKLEEALIAFGYPFELNEGDGAFYGPKIDITIKDALGRKHQCATIQLDFQLPVRFNLSYAAKESPNNDVARPIIIHRAILGSVERMIAILTESFGGKWPFWLSPRQITIIPVANIYIKYAESVKEKFHKEGFFVEVDTSDNTLPKKIRNAEISQVNFTFVVGGDEESSNTVNIRNRDSQVKGKSETSGVDLVISQMVKLRNEKRNDNILQTL